MSRRRAKSTRLILVSLDPQPVAEEYGITPSAFGPALLEDASEEDGEQSFAGLLVCPESGAGNLVEAETETKAQTIPNPRGPASPGALG